jgi:hypothetical protein
MATGCIGADHLVTTEPQGLEEDLMLGPNTDTFRIANQEYDERLRHAARIRLAAADRHDETSPVATSAHRRLTVARLTRAAGAALVAGAALATAVAAAATSAAGGGGATLIR